MVGCIGFAMPKTVCFSSIRRLSLPRSGYTSGVGYYRTHLDKAGVLG
jgi:hypothetical protein